MLLSLGPSKQAVVLVPAFHVLSLFRYLTWSPVCNDLRCLPAACHTASFVCSVTF